MKQADILLRAKDYLEQINNYTDPLTGQELPMDSVFRDPTVRRSLFFVPKNLGWIVAYDGDWGRLPFAPDPNLRKWVKPRERKISGMDMVALLNWTRDVASNQSLNLSALKKYLVERGYLRLSNEKYTVTPEGIQAGFRICQSSHDPTVLFEPSAQQLLLDNLDDLSDHCKAHCTEEAGMEKRRVKITGREALQGNIRVVRALGQGRHPVTGQPLPDSDPATQERMKTCFAYVAGALERALELGYFSAKEPFHLSREKWGSLSPLDEACSQAEFLQTVNATLDDPTAVQLVSSQELTDLLEAEGLIAKETSANGRARRVATPKGEAQGITRQERMSQKGEPYQAWVYPPEIQRMLIAKLERFVQD